MKQASQIELIKLANELDKAGHSSLANRIDHILKLAQEDLDDLGSLIDGDPNLDPVEPPRGSTTPGKGAEKPILPAPSDAPGAATEPAAGAATEPAAGAATEPAAGAATEPAAEAAAEPAAEAAAEPAAEGGEEDAATEEEKPKSKRGHAGTKGYGKASPDSIKEFNGMLASLMEDLGKQQSIFSTEGLDPAPPHNSSWDDRTAWLLRENPDVLPGSWTRGTSSAWAEFANMAGVPDAAQDWAGFASGKTRDGSSTTRGTRPDGSYYEPTLKGMFTFWEDYIDTVQRGGAVVEAPEEGAEEAASPGAEAAPEAGGEAAPEAGGEAATGAQLMAALRQSEGGDRALEKARTHVGRQLRWKTTKAMGKPTNRVMRPERQLRLAQEALQSFVEARWQEPAQQQQAYQLLLSQIESDLRGGSAQGNEAHDDLPHDDLHDDLFAESSEKFDTMKKVSDLLGREFSIGVTPFVRR
jgi:hypothetical protein